MASIMEEFLSSLGPEVSSKLSANLGIEENAVQQMLPQIGPMILGGLKRQKDNYGGQERVDHILNKYGSADVLDDIGDFFSSQVQNREADPRLGGLLGDSGVQATNMLSKQFNLDGNTAMKIIPMLAPILLGFLTKTRDQGARVPAGSLQFWTATVMAASWMMWPKCFCRDQRGAPEVVVAVSLAVYWAVCWVAEDRNH